MNYFLVPLVLIMFLVAEINLAVFYRLLADYDRVIDMRSHFLNGNQKLYWSILTFMLLVYFLLMIIEYFLLNLCISNSSNTAHKNMMNSIVRSPSSFFDETPSGVIVNKLSNDFGTIDSNLFYALVEAVEGPIIALITLVNISMINIIFLPPALIILCIAVCYFNYSRPAYAKCKELFL